MPSKEIQSIMNELECDERTAMLKYIDEECNFTVEQLKLYLEKRPTNMTCIECDYSLTPNEFDAGKGRIMFSEGEGIEKGQFRCGKCDIRADEMGYFPIEDEVHRCGTCGCELDEEYWKEFAYEKCTTEPNEVYCSFECEQ